MPMTCRISMGIARSSVQTAGPRGACGGREGRVRGRVTLIRGAGAVAPLTPLHGPIAALSRGSCKGAWENATRVWGVFWGHDPRETRHDPP